MLESIPWEDEMLDVERRCGAGMTLVNTDGLTFLGPGSEWFWTAFQGVVVAVTLWGLLRQLRLQTAQKMREDSEAFDAEWDSERMLRYRLTVASARRDGELDTLRGAAPNFIANFWDEVATLAHSKHIDKGMLLSLMGDAAVRSWLDLEPWVRRAREVSAPHAFSDWEWLVAEAIRSHPSLRTVTPAEGEAEVRMLDEWIATEVELRR